MSGRLRALCAALALATLAAPALPFAGGADACCEDERSSQRDEAPCPDCPPGLACGCCAVRPVEPASAFVVRPETGGASALPAAAAAACGRAATQDIFHPPRA